MRRWERNGCAVHAELPFRFSVICKITIFTFSMQKFRFYISMQSTLCNPNISVQGATNDIKKCFRYAEWKSQIFHSVFTYSLVVLIDEIRPSVAFLLSSKLIFSQSSR